jgi:hypothetical protein
MGGWLKNRFGRTVAVGTLAVAGVGGLAYAVAGPLSAPTVASTNFQASGTSGASGGSACQGAPGGAGAATSAAVPGGSKAGACPGAGRKGLLGRLLARTAHASLTVKDKSGRWVTVDLDRGTVQSVSSTSITILRPDGVTVTEAIDSSTRFLRQPQSSVVVGDRVVLVAEGGTARYVLAGKPAVARPGQHARPGKPANPANGQSGASAGSSSVA